MIHTVFTAGLPIGESLVVRKNRITGISKRGPRVAIVTGMHGDELEGQYVAFELARRLNERIEELVGTVDIYPALNPLGLSSHAHGVPTFDIDLDRTFPGDAHGNLTDALAAAVLDDIKGAQACVVIHSSNASVDEVTQVRIDETNPNRLLKLASLLNARLIWVRPPTPQLEATLAHALNQLRTPTLVVEMGAGMRLTESSGAWLVEGILRLLEHLHAWTGPTIFLPAPLVSDGSNVVAISSDTAGIFIPYVENGSDVVKEQLLGIVANPLSGTVAQEVRAPRDGLLFTLRAYPATYPGSLLARILEVTS